MKAACDYIYIYIYIVCIYSSQLKATFTFDLQARSLEYWSQNRRAES